MGTQLPLLRMTHAGGEAKAKAKAKDSNTDGAHVAWLSQLSACKARLSRS
jgi:hypothetical protein